MASCHLERFKISLFDCLVVGLSFQYPARQEELFGQFLMPLLAQIGRRNDQNPPFPFSPSLRHEPGSFRRDGRNVSGEFWSLCRPSAQAGIRK